MRTGSWRDGSYDGLPLPLAGRCLGAAILRNAMTPLDSRTLTWRALCRDLARAGGPVRWAWAATRDQNGAWRAAHFAVRAPADATRLRLRYEMIVLLVDDQGKVVDRRGWESGSIQPVEDEPTLLAHVERWRHEGESDTVEFKRALDDSKPRHRFAESVAAFANTAGGAVLVGVGDDGGIAGYDPPKAKDKLARIIADSVDEPPETTIARLEVEGSPVWVVQVPVSPPAARPHTDRGRVLVRAHGTNRPATAREIREMSADPQSATELAWLLR
jgi:hypothetical protein